LANAAYLQGKLELETTFRWNEATAGVEYLVMLVTNGYTFNKGHLTFADMSAHEVTGTGYTGGFGGSGRKVLSTRVIELDGDFVRFTSLPVLWTAVNGFTPSAAIVGRKPSGATLNSDIRALYYIDQGTGSDVFGQLMNGSNFSLVCDSGWYRH
jgi:hypothetical protein